MNTCIKCGGTRWKTKIKHIQWQCKRCGYIKNIKEILQPLPQIYKELVSIIIPIIRNDPHIKECLEAIDKSTYRNVEIIVVDEGLERSAQRNIGIRKATGEYLLILDSDMMITPELIADCVEKIKDCVGIYIPEQIITKGWFGKLRNWERQFYTATDVDVVRFVRAKDCPLFDEALHGVEDSDWERRIIGKRTISDFYVNHHDKCGVIKFFKKKAYYAQSIGRYKKKWQHDRLLTFKYRCCQIFLENGKWKRFIAKPHFAFGVILLLLARGIIYKCTKKHLS